MSLSSLTGDGRVAATMFLRRGVSGDAWVDVHSLELTTTGNHGVAVVVWGTKRPLDITALDADGSRLGPVRLRDPPGY
jgi:hypothetical protein